MAQDIQIFNNPNFGEIRTAGTSDEPLFCLADICRVLEIQSGATKNRLDEKGISLINTPTSGGVQSLVYINEKNLYKVIMRSDKPQAEPFQDWVCGDVLPSIRKTGEYSVKTEASNPSISDKMKVATWLIKTLNLDDHSKLVIAKSIADPLGLPTPEYVEDEVMLPISKILSRKGISISPQKANKKLLEIGLLEQVERYSKRKGRNEQKYIISKKGKKFGKMHQFKDASFPSPAWFVDKSDDLINLIVNTTTGGFTYGK